MQHSIVNLLIIDDNQETIAKIHGYTKKFNINIQAFFEPDLNTAIKIIKDCTIDYLFISCELIKQADLQKITHMLKATHNGDCIIVFHNIPENHCKDFKNGNFLLPDELSFDLFKKLIGYSLVNKNIIPNSSNEASEIYQDDFVNTHDALTMLPNRVFLLNKIESLLKAAPNNQQKFAVFFIDLDGFKAVNDAGGHGTGDLVLKEVARRLIKNTRATDIVSRHGGDEFVILLPHIANKEDVEIVANKILAIINEPFYINHEIWAISASIGVAAYPYDGETAEKLIANADSAMYSAKQEGKSVVRYFNNELDEQIAKKISILNEIRGSIINNNFEILLQPQHELKTGKLIGAEVFVRWNHPTKGLIMPSDFLPYILNTGYINSLGNLILKKALAVHYEIKNLTDNNLSIAINVEPRQLINDDLIDHLIGLKSLGINMKNLVIEITEDCFKTNFDIIKKKLYKLRENGIKVCLDDFGLGDSSLTKLIELPIDILKIDNKILCSSEKSESIKKGTISLSKSFNIKTMAKRIDDLNQLKELLVLGCDYGQGYCYSKPLTVAQFINYVKNLKANQIQNLSNREDSSDQ